MPQLLKFRLLSSMCSGLVPVPDKPTYLVREMLCKPAGVVMVTVA